MNFFVLARYYVITGSSTYPYVSLFKTECGLKKNVGTIPDSRISSLYSGTIAPIVLFYAFLDMNLSPSAGYLVNYVYIRISGASSFLSLILEIVVYLQGYARSYVVLWSIFSSVLTFDIKVS